MKLSRVMLAAAVVTALVTPAYGMTFKVEFGALWYVHASGEIINGDTERFVQSLDAAKVFEDKDPIENRIIVYLDSPGGSVAEGLKLGRVITKLRALTDVARRTKGDNFAPGICASACVLAYLGGDYRYLTKDSKIKSAPVRLPSSRRSWQPRLSSGSNRTGRTQNFSP
jgi:hypothetical protein